MLLYMFCILSGLVLGSFFKKKKLPRKKVILYTVIFLFVFNILYFAYFFLQQ